MTGGMAGGVPMKAWFLATVTLVLAACAPERAPQRVSPNANPVEGQSTSYVMVPRTLQLSSASSAVPNKIEIDTSGAVLGAMVYVPFFGTVTSTVLKVTQPTILASGCDAASVKLESQFGSDIGHRAAIPKAWSAYGAEFTANGDITIAPAFSLTVPCRSLILEFFTIAK